MSKHITSIHERKKPNKCHICDSCFVEKTDLKSHIDRFHEGKNPYKCLTCDIDFSRKSSLTYHIATIHEGKNPYQCNSCDSQFFNMNLLKKHRVSVHDKVSHNCNLCGKIFLQKGHLNRHTKNVHEGKKPGDHFVSEITNESENTEYHLIDCDVEIKEEWDQPEQDSIEIPEENPEELFEASLKPLHSMAGH